MKTKLILMSMMLLLVLVVGGCGGPKPDVSIFVLPSTGMPSEIAGKLEQSLQAKLGPSPTVKVTSSPIFSPDVLVVQVAAGDHGIVIVSRDQWLSLAQNGGMVPLDDLFNKADYPDGVVELPVDDKEGKKETHLYAIPVSHTKWMTDAGYKGEELYAFVHPRAPHMDQAKQVLQAIAAK